MSTTMGNIDGFFKSSFSNDGPSCVEVKFDDEQVLIQDTKDRESGAWAGAAQPVISVPASSWAEFLDLVLSAESGTVNGDVSIFLHQNGGATVRDRKLALAYNPDEWDAFMKGVADGQFTRP